NCAVVQVNLISRNQELLSQLCPVGLLIAIVEIFGWQRMIVGLSCGLSFSQGEGETCSCGYSCGRKQKATAIEHECVSKVKAGSGNMLDCSRSSVKTSRLVSCSAL